MSDRHLHITSYLYDDAERLAVFEAEARKRFVLVQPVTNGKGRVIAFALYSRDGGGEDLTGTLPDAAGALSGILTHDIDIVSAWENTDGTAQRVWPVKGREQHGKK